MIAGVDEAGRGPLAGPVVAACVVLYHPIEGLNDSKKLSKAKIHKLFPLITQNAYWAYATGSIAEIDRINILNATKLAMQRSVAALSITPHKVLIDGRDVVATGLPTEAIIKGDQKEQCIMAASIVAKYMRDCIMAAMAIRYPEYGFEKHAGYPTAFHKEMIRLHGITALHRKSFCREKA